MDCLDSSLNLLTRWLKTPASTVPVIGSVSMEILLSKNGVITGSQDGHQGRLSKRIKSSFPYNGPDLIQEIEINTTTHPEKKTFFKLELFNVYTRFRSIGNHPSILYKL